MCPRMQTPGGGVWAGTPPCGKTPPGPALHLNGRRDRRPLAGRARAQGAPADLPRLDRCSPAGHLEGLQAEGAQPRRICRTPRRNPAQLAGHQDRHPVPPQRRTGPAPRPFRPLKDCRPTPPGGWIYPQPLRPDPMQPARQLPPGHQRPGRRGNCATPGHKMQPEGQQPGPAGHLNTGSPAPCGFGQMDTQAPARPCPHPRKICRDGRGQRCHLNRGRAAADTGQPAQLDTSTPGQIRPQ